MLEKYALFKVIKAIVRETEELGLRDIARKAGVSASTAKTCLDFLLKNSIVAMRLVGKSHLFKIRHGFLASQIKRLYSLAEISSSGIITELLANKKILSIVLYGSVAKGEDDKNSDIDLLVISRKKIKRPELKGKLDREVSLLICTYSEWKEKAEKDSAFYNEVILNCIPLYGEKPVVI